MYPSLDHCEASCENNMDDHREQPRIVTCITDHGAPATDSAPSVHSPRRIRANELFKKLSLFSLAESLDPGPATLTVPLTIQQGVILISLIMLVIAVLQIPTILFYINSPSPADSTFINDIDWSTCTVSFE